MNYSRPCIAVLMTLLLTMSPVILDGCGRLTQVKTTGEKAITNFHALYNQGRIQKIWKDADPRFRTATTMLKYEELMKAIQRKLGEELSTSNISWQVQSYNMETLIRFSQATTYQHGEGMEFFTFAVKGTNSMLTDYNIQSADLMIR